MAQERESVVKTFSCSQCPKFFATRSNLKRHMENPNIHNIPYVRSRDQKRWKGHAKKVVSKEETTERMRKWRAENKDKNKRNDLRCRVYRLARQKFGEQDSIVKQVFIRDEIARRLGRRMLLEQKEQQKKHDEAKLAQKQSGNALLDLPFYSAPQHKIQLPSIFVGPQGTCHPGHAHPSSPTSASASSLSSPAPSSSSSPSLPHLSPGMQRRTSSCSLSSASSTSSERSCCPSPAKETPVVLPSLHTLLSYPLPLPSRASRPASPYSHQRDGVKYVDHTRILDEFVGLVLTYADED